MKNGKQKQDFLFSKIQEMKISEFTINDLWEKVKGFKYDYAVIENNRAVKKTASVFSNLQSMRFSVNALIIRGKLKLIGRDRQIKKYGI